MTNGDFYDDLEIRDPEVREKELFDALAGHLAYAKEQTSYFAALLKDVDPDAVMDRKALAGLPVTRKSELVNIQTAGDPMGGMAVGGAGALRRIYQSPGPTYDGEGKGQDWWGTARALHACGLRAGGILHNAFAYTFTPAGLMMDGGASALGAAVFPAGVGNTDLQIQAMHDIKPTCFTGTPSFLRLLLEKAKEQDKDLSSLTSACVGGEALLPDLRQSIEVHGIHCGQVYASADIGSIAYESPAREGLIADERLIIEIVRPGTGDPVPEGEVGEVVVTVLRDAYPLIRFATGDLSAVLAGQSPCGRTNMRLKGWMGRADQTTKVKGMFVHPAQVAEVVTRVADVDRIRVVVTNDGMTDVMTWRCESGTGGDALLSEIQDAVQSVCKLKGVAEIVEPGTLPNDGKVIEDTR